LPRTANTQVSPIYSLTFTTDPRIATGATGYGWEKSSPTDSGPVALAHQGILTLNGQQYVDLNAITGPYAVVTSNPLPMIGGGTTGWTFELMVKLGTEGTWAKILDIGSARGTNGLCVNDIVIGWDSVNPRGQVDLCDGTGNGIQYYTPDAFGIIIPGVWYHLVLVLTPLSNGQGNWYTYINGQFYSGLGNYLYPPAVVRSWSYIGKSNWGDPNLIAEIDTFNIYNSALSDVQVTNIYNLAITPGGGTKGSSSTGQNGGSSSSSLSGGAIAGIVIGTVVGAIIICFLLVCLCRGGSSKGGKGYEDQTDVGPTGRNNNPHDESTNQSEGDVEMTA